MFSAKERAAVQRAAVQWAEAVTLISQTGAPDAAYGRLRLALFLVGCQTASHRETLYG